MYTVLSTRRLQFDSSPDRLVELALQYRFDAVDALVPVFLESASARERYAGLVRDAQLRWGLAGMPAPLGTTTSDAEFEDLLDTLRALAPNLAAAGVTTMSAWLAPANDEAPFAATFDLHRRRLDAIAPILAESGLRLALEYVGPRTWRAPFRYEFISDLAGVRELIDSLAESDRFGVLLDTFHWYTAGETVQDIRALDSRQILAVDLNDAPAGRPVDQQLDMDRAQPGATGVIDAVGFVSALRAIDYRGPVQSEPFSASLREQPEEQRVAEARAALSGLLEVVR